MVCCSCDSPNFAAYSDRAASSVVKKHLGTVSSLPSRASSGSPRQYSCSVISPTSTQTPVIIPGTTSAARFIRKMCGLVACRVPGDPGGLREMSFCTASHPARSVKVPTPGLPPRSEARASLMKPDIVVS